MKVTLINRNLPEESFEILKKTLEKKLSLRGVALSEKDADVSWQFRIDSTMESDSYSVEAQGKEVIFSANNLCTVFAAAGRYLVKGRFDQKGGFEPPAMPLKHKMRDSLRGMYFASHFYNFYHAAPIEEVLEIIAEQALNGCNMLMLCFGVQHYTSAKTQEAQQMIARMKLMLKYADKCGIAPALILFSNTGFDGSPAELEAQFNIDDSGRYYRNITAVFTTELCPNKKGGIEEIERQQREFFEAFADTPIKYFALWPYDEGGCLCEKCYPWATNGFMKVADLSRRLIKEYGYDAQIIISTWHFEMNMKDEWSVFYEELKKGTYNWAPYIMTSFRSAKLPKCFQEGGIPEGVHLIDFPEISMLDAKPWGGFGANPVTMFLDNYDKACGKWHEGGFPYSEGIFEDINKWVCYGFYTGHYENSADAVRDYIRYEFGMEDTDDLLRAIQLMETCLTRGHVKLPSGEFRFPIQWGRAIPEIYRIVTSMDEKLPETLRKNWKWRIVYLRAVLDYELYQNDYITKYSETAQAAYHELHSIFHTQKALFEVCPPEGK